MFKPTRWVAGVLAGALVLSALSAGVVSASTAKPKGKKDSGTLYAAITHTVGGTEYIAGNISDKVLGQGAATFTATVGTGSTPGTIAVHGKVTAFFKNGSLSGTGSATLTTSASGPVTFTGGKLTLKTGAGLEKGHSFVVTFTGTGGGVTGPYVFHYTGTYK